jgi:hypothetical protein
VIWFVGSVINLRRFYATRHGVPIEPHAQGTQEALWLSILWPVLLFVDWYKSPPLCSHLLHVEQRESYRHRIQRAEQILRHEQGQC